MAATSSSPTSGQLASLLANKAGEDAGSLHLRKTLEQAIPTFSSSNSGSSLTPSEEAPPSSSYFSFSFTRSFSTHLSNRTVMPLLYSLIRHCRDGGIHFLQSTYSPLLLSESIVKKLETDCRAESSSDESSSSVESFQETLRTDELSSNSCQQLVLDDSYEEVFEEEDEDLNLSDESEEDETDDDEEDYDEDELVQFSYSEEPTVSAPPVTCQLKPPGIKHISSFSSEESGFCESTNYPEWSNSEDEELDDEAIDSCSFDEGLWHMLEDQACFTNIPTCSTLKSTKGILNRAEECTTTDHKDTDNVEILCPDLFNSTTDKVEEMCSDSCSTLSEETVCSRTKEKGKRRVCFKPDNELVEVHCIIAWEFAYRNARKGNWEQYSVDRERFKRRIESIAAVIEPCLKQKLVTGNTYR